MDQFLIMTLWGIFVLLILSAFFSGSETALTAVSRPLLHQLERNGHDRARMVNELSADKGRLIGAILIGNNLVNILASVLATGILIELFGPAGIAYATIAMTILVVVFAEVLPKTYALTHADRMALAVAPILRLFVVLFSPFSRATQVIVRLILRIFGITLSNGQPEAFVEEELRGAIELHKGDDVLFRDEKSMLHSILDLDDVEVGEVMIHRSAVAAIDADLPTPEIMHQVVESPFTRIPLWRDKPENIIGILHAKALLREIEKHPGNLETLKVPDLATVPWFIPESTDLLSQLRAFRKRREHFALVVDEYGDLMGIVTLEDILEEIVGDISDEHDVRHKGIRPQPDGDIIVDGDVTIRDLNREFDWQLPDEDAATIAGLVLHESRLIPDAGQIFMFFGYRFEILARSGNRISALRITPNMDQSDQYSDTGDNQASQI
jgi:Mg2+/Co2+ transporter CorB